MRVRNLTPWAGNDFSYAPGDEIELDDAIAEARIADGLCEAVTVPTSGRRKAKAETETEN